MKFYFGLQYKRLRRTFEEAGISILFGFPLLIILFSFGSLFLFSKIDFAAYVYGFLGLSLLLKVGDINRNSFLEGIYKKANFTKIRLAENFIVISPFLLFLLFKSEFLIAFLTLFFAFVLAFVKFKSKDAFTIPTPFYKFPFEFSTTFRKAYPLLILAYFILFMAIQVNNFNLMVFALFLLFMFCVSSYSEPEPEFYVWIYSRSPASFIGYKIGIAFLYSSIITIPLVGLGVLFFMVQAKIIILFQIFGYLTLLTIILAKYAAFPNQINLVEGIFIFLVLWFPPLLIFVLPVLFYRSINHLNYLLK